MVQYIQVNGPMECAMVTVINCGLMVHAMKVNGTRIKPVARVDYNMQTVIFMKVIGFKTRHKVMELIHMHMEHYMKETG